MNENEWKLKEFMIWIIIYWTQINLYLVCDKEKAKSVPVAIYSQKKIILFENIPLPSNSYPLTMQTAEHFVWKETKMNFTQD